MGLYMLVFMGGTPIGAPVIGAITSHFGARAGMALCGAVPCWPPSSRPLPRPARPTGPRPRAGDWVNGRELTRAG